MSELKCGKGLLSTLLQRLFCLFYFLLLRKVVFG